MTVTTVTRFGQFTCDKGETDDPRDFWIDFVDFEFSDETATPIEKVKAILTYIENALSEGYHSEDT